MRAGWVITLALDRRGIICETQQPWAAETALNVPDSHSPRSGKLANRMYYMHCSTSARVHGTCAHGGKVLAGRPKPAHALIEQALAVVAPFPEVVKPASVVAQNEVSGGMWLGWPCVLLCFCCSLPGTFTGNQYEQHPPPPQAGLTGWAGDACGVGHSLVAPKPVRPLEA